MPRPNASKKLVTFQTCGCRYCKSCLRQAFTVGLTKATYPARCCGRPLEVSTVEKCVDRRVARAYRGKEEETSANLPIYCAKSSCGAFVGDGVPSVVDSDETGGVETEEQFLTCGMCHMKTCARVGSKRLHREPLGSHAICPESLEDKGVKKVLSGQEAEARESILVLKDAGWHILGECMKREIFITWNNVSEG